jgi:hypothetical protein
MKTTDFVHICPYTGLRSFTEEESLYFKGRDLQVDQITALLEKNKFLMVTGASGEGKSSIIYGGLIPNARAGFFRAKYSNWVVADFRPERSPLANMAKALAAQFNSNPDTVETELRRGYSSLIDLYTNSSYFIDEQDDSLQQPLDVDLKEKKRKACNLLILVDQFEEFFTNPENFYNEAPSKDSQIVVNLILETARIAIRKNLPVYVVCTMRSDYIGQCSAFRGLPEYIGFSQFFVPRLKRKDLKQVIEVPAQLSGNRISQRLIERLVFDISDGVDQLPILQHALTRIWAAADHGAEEMDLIHYAMVGGMAADELPEEDIPRFTGWFDGLPQDQRNFYQDTGLAKIIEIHANLLYERAWEYYNGQNPQLPITQQEGKRIVALTFSCLTKIDNSRAVRNRMSMEEITSIINAPKFNATVVGAVINIFREEGNSFIRPFKTEDPATHQLSGNTVLDITHESLIRNWNKLNQWANREFEFYSTFLDFQKQLDRWKESGMSRGYLLPIGPLTYFENWYLQCRPNAAWIKRYLDAAENPQRAQAKADETLRDTRLFLKRSARKEMVTRAFMKFGPRRIATAFAILAMLTLTGFYWYDADQKKNDRVIQKLRDQSFSLINSKNVNLSDKAIYLLTEERYDSGSLVPYLEALPYKSKISLTTEVYKQFLYFNKQNPDRLKSALLDLAFHNLKDANPSEEPSFQLTETNKLVVLLAMDNYYLPDPLKEEMLVRLTKNNYQLALQYFRDKRMFRPSVPFELNLAIQYWLSLGKPVSEQVDSLIQSISPLGSVEAQDAFHVYYPKGSFEQDGRMPFDYNGGYHTVASLYAAAGDMPHLYGCFDKLLEIQRNYFELPRISNNHLNILGYLYQYGHRDQVPGVLGWLATRTQDNPPKTIMRNLVIRSGYITHIYQLNLDPTYYRSVHGYIFPNLYFCPRPVFDAMTEDNEKVISQIPDPSERAFTLAQELKLKAMYYSKYWFDRKLPADEQKLNGWLKKATDIYAHLDKNYLDQKQSSTLVYNSDGVRTSDVKRNDLLIYPDYRDGWFSWTYHTDYLFNYLKKNGLLASFYSTGQDLQALHYWVAKAYEYIDGISPSGYSNRYPLPDQVLIDILSFVDQHPDGKSFDRNLLYLILCNHAFTKGDTTSALAYYRSLDLQHIKRSSDKYEYLEKIFFFNMMSTLCINLSTVGLPTEAIALAEQFTLDQQKIFPYLMMAQDIYRKNAKPIAFEFLDSAFAKARHVDFSKVLEPIDSRYFTVMVLSEIGSRPLNDEAELILSEIPDDRKFNGILARARGVASEGNYYRALTSIPNTLTESQDLQCRSAILLEACKHLEQQSGAATKWKPMDEFSDWNWNYITYLPY